MQWALSTHIRWLVHWSFNLSASAHARGPVTWIRLSFACSESWRAQASHVLGYCESVWLLYLFHNAGSQCMMGQMQDNMSMHGTLFRGPNLFSLGKCLLYCHVKSPRNPRKWTGGRSLPSRSETSRRGDVLHTWVREALFLISFLFLKHVCLIMLAANFVDQCDCYILLSARPNIYQVIGNTYAVCCE